MEVPDGYWDLCILPMYSIQIFFSLIFNMKQTNFIIDIITSPFPLEMSTVHSANLQANGNLKRQINIKYLLKIIITIHRIINHYYLLHILFKTNLCKKYTNIYVFKLYTKKCNQLILYSIMLPLTYGMHN